MIQVHVHRGDHRIVVLVLLMGQSFLELPFVVVVNDGDGAYRLRGFFPPSGREPDRGRLPSDSSTRARISIYQTVPVACCPWRCQIG